ncbi:MAG: transcriptional repressor [Lachnospiraceae bacterium]|nr:transcriptional repressor [Lachnospiraceae bacterium]
MKNTKSEYKTKTRMMIIEFLKENSDKCFTANDIYLNLTQNGQSINRSTVYRNIEKLCNEGKLVKYKEADSVATVYQYSEGHDHCDRHMHAQCSECGKIFHLESEFVEEFENKIQSCYGIDVDCSKTIIVGKCDDCK